MMPAGGGGPRQSKLRARLNAVLYDALQSHGLGIDQGAQKQANDAIQRAIDWIARSPGRVTDDQAVSIFQQMVDAAVQETRDRGKQTVEAGIIVWLKGSDFCPNIFC